MNFEELLDEARPLEKDLSDRMKAQQRLAKSIHHAMEGGDLKSWLRDMAALQEVTAAYADCLSRLRETAEGFDARAYVENGDFADQLLGYCKAVGLDIKGDFPIYEIFPYRVRVDTENLDLYVDRKKVQCLRPQSFAGEVKAGRDKLMKASFNALAFAGELADAYDTALLRQAKGKAVVPDADCYLTSLYQYLVPMSRQRKEYDKQSFAFDLARLYSADVEEIKDGRRFQFGPSRNNAKAIRILDNEGTEKFLATIRFFK
jgi:hypothetical protein